MNAKISLNRYAPNFFNLKALKISNLAREAFGIIATFVKYSGRCYVCRDYFSKYLLCALGSVSRAITELVNAGLIKRTGEFYALLFPVVEITAKGKQYTEPETAPLQASHENVTPPSQNCYTEEKNINNNIKEQETTSVCLPIKLSSFGISKNQAKELLNTFPEERIELQIENLAQVIEQKKEIKNKAGWLIKAIKNNFCPSGAQENLEEKRREHEAERLFQRARDLEASGQLEEAKKEALASLEVYSSTRAQNLLESLNKLLDKKEAIANARAAISEEQWEAIRFEELKKQLVITRKLGGPKLDKLAHLNAVTAAHERLLERLTVGNQ